MGAFAVQNFARVFIGLNNSYRLNDYMFKRVHL